ncbi:MAG: NTP transferase domain-containing protein [Olsenella sp.]|nr:NTP transferase domain-containing protein [Olsenella sp.]MCI1793562.1 NTP transferase domain-containing protein [Olsenella sp.]MCI1811325.1 NTP transferase domain-containing protein [Olsenella sp.]MCI1879826.1 NTP transferase domain-containing protein [Olsenella sp.]
MEPRVFSFLIDEDGGRFFGPGPMALLAGVRETGSLSASAKAMGMSYTKAMRILHDAEHALGCSLTVRSIGGEKGGSSSLTPEAEDFLHRYEEWRQGVTAVANAGFSAAFAGVAGVPRLGCVVMANGEATRFGRQKLVEPLRGRAVVSHTLDALVSQRLDVVVSTRWERVRAVCEVRYVDCVKPAGALQSDTLRAGIEALGKRAGYLFVQGDQPLLSGASVEALLDEFAAHPACVVRLAWQGKPGSPVIFPGYLADALLGLEGDVGGGELLRRNPDLASAARLVEARYPAELDDIDTPPDLERVTSELVAVREAMESGQDIWPAAGEKDGAPGELGSSL